MLIHLRRPGRLKVLFQSVVRHCVGIIPFWDLICETTENPVKIQVILVFEIGLLFIPFDHKQLHNSLRGLVEEAPEYVDHF